MKQCDRAVGTVAKMKYGPYAYLVNYTILCMSRLTSRAKTSLNLEMPLSEIETLDL